MNKKTDIYNYIFYSATMQNGFLLNFIVIK